MILDIKSGRPQRFDQKAGSFPWQPQRIEIDTNLEKVQEIRNGSKLAQFPVLFSDIDVNRHVNSACYMRWMLDSHLYEHLKTKEIKSIELSFLSAALPEDEVTVFSEQMQDHELCSVRRSCDDKELCRAKLEWRCS